MTTALEFAPTIAIDGDAPLEELMDVADAKLAALEASLAAYTAFEFDDYKSLDDWLDDMNYMQYLEWRMKNSSIDWSDERKRKEAEREKRLEAEWGQRTKRQSKELKELHEMCDRAEQAIESAQLAQKNRRYTKMSAITLTPATVSQIAGPLRAMVRDEISNRQAVLRYSHTRGLSAHCECPTDVGKAQYAKPSQTQSKMTRNDVFGDGDVSGNRWTTEPRAQPGKPAAPGAPAKSKIKKEDQHKHAVTEGMKFDREERADYGEGAEGGLNATALNQLVEALRPVIREIIDERVGESSSGVSEVESLKEIIKDLQAKLNAANSAATGVAKSSKQIAATSDALPEELTARYARQAVLAVHAARERGEEADFEATLRSLVSRHLAGDDSEEFEVIRHAAQEDEEHDRAQYQLHDVRQRIRRLESTGPGAEKRERYSKQAMGDVHRARQAGQSLSYGDALASVYSSHGETMPR